MFSSLKRKNSIANTVLHWVIKIKSQNLASKSTKSTGFIQDLFKRA